MEPECRICEETQDLIFGPDPFDSEVLGIDDDVYLCRTCFRLTADEVESDG
jgi:hypothetical protein